MQLDNLGRAFNITEAELILNRSGKMSQRQRNRVRRKALMIDGIVSIMIMISGGIPLWGAYRVITSPHNVWWFTLLLVVFGITICLAGIEGFRRAIRIANTKEVMCITGKIARQIKQMGEGTSYQIIVDEQIFPVSPQIYESFIPQSRYHIYYLVPDHVVVAAESAHASLEEQSAS